jgi:hypothetical protein
LFGSAVVGAADNQKILLAQQQELMAQGLAPPDSTTDGDYLMMEELDEENINWGKLLTRAFCLLLLVIIICCVSDLMVSLVFIPYLIGCCW